MGIRLRILSRWTPNFIIKQELSRTNNMTNSYLNQLISAHGGSPPEIDPLVGNIEERRKKMAMEHNLRVKILTGIAGEEKAISEGRKKMFEAGLLLGKHAKNVLGVNENNEDAVKAAKILYNVLGIDFSLEISDDNIILWVTSCALSKYYTPQTCNILSYADKGVLKGLNKNMDLEFVEKITSGSKRCKGCINIEGGIQ